MTNERLLTISGLLKHAADCFELATQYSDEIYLRQAIGYFQTAGEFLGYRRVPITTPQQEHDALLAARVAEDGPPPVTSAPGFDGRDSSIGMREQDIEGEAV